MYSESDAQGCLRLRCVDLKMRKARMAAVTAIAPVMDPPTTLIGIVGGWRAWEAGWAVDRGREQPGVRSIRRRD